MQLFPSAICVLLWSLMANSCSDSIARSTDATVLLVQGRVSFGSNERADSQPVVAKTKIHQGDIVRSSDGAFVDLQLIPGALARLSADSEITIEELKLVKDGNDTSDGMRNRSARLRLNRGKILILFSRAGTGSSQVTIRANQVTVSPDSDCLFSVCTDGTRTRVTCARDKISASDAAQRQVTINAGYFQNWPQTAPKPLQSAGNAAAQVDTREAIEAERQVLDEASASQNHRPF
jgi:hypothetical protein